ncbi:MFS transporter [Microbacterium barkeri]|uniref:MFS transporter n=1 Tax=Microbacterium barkeri TaxID=33917 RepID=A0A9W6H4F6_9MICO|nr:MFS transporter [Microbacterium barkeri]MDI6944418.1 MFS transporter [Microbacterium barkeri]MDR6877494.1 MFS family permease [Microbacterium barkeri]GLJ62431.1 MFS transporter [Microbacterium barkeri]
MSTITPTLRRVGVRETRRATGIAFFAWTIAVYDFILFGTLLPRIEEGFGWEPSFALLVSTFVSIGTFIVVILVGPLVDRLGRRKGMVISVGGTAASSAATAITQGAVSLVGVRAISGLGLAEQSVNATYLNELYSVTDDEKIKRNQGFVYSMVQTGWPLGALLAAGFVAIMTAIVGPENWRIVFLVATVPAIIVALLCLTLKESPQFVAMRHIKKLSAAGDHEGAEQFARSVGLDVQKHAPFRRIFQGRHLRSTIVLSLAWLFNWFGIQTFSVLGTTVLESGKGFDASNALIMIVLSNIVGALGYLTHGWLGDRLGRRNVIVGGWLLGGVMFAAMLLGPSNPVFVLVTYMLGLFFLLGPYAAIMFFQAECYDADCRATGSTFIGAMSQPGAVIAGFILTGLVAAAVPFSMAAFIVGALGTFLSGLIMLFVKKGAGAVEPRVGEVPA